MYRPGLGRDTQSRYMEDGPEWYPAAQTLRTSPGEVISTSASRVPMDSVLEFRKVAACIARLDWHVLCALVLARQPG